MGSLSNYLENALLNHALKGSAFSQPTNIYIALSTADPTDAGSGIAEPSGNNYARKLHNTWNTAANRAIDNDGDITFNQASGAWGTLTHWAIFDHATAGNMLAHGSLTTQKSVVASNIPKINSGDVDISFNSGGISTYLANALLNHTFKNTAYTQPTNIYIALSTANPGDTGSGTAEPSGNNYARAQCNAWDESTVGASQNTNIVTFNTASGSWGTISHQALYDNATTGAGNLLFYSAVDNPQAVTTDDIPQYAAGAFDITMD